MVPAKEYVFVIYARPDLSFRSPLDLSLLKTLSSTQLYTPRWGCWMGGVNDRFAAGQARAARAFGRRFDLLANVSDLPLDHAQRQNGLHAELFARYALEVAGIRPVHAPKPETRRTQSVWKRLWETIRRRRLKICFTDSSFLFSSAG